MKIISMSINKYKSILTEQTIVFSDQVMTFIGRNGTGKSNILLAINDFFLNARYRYANNAPNAEFKVRLELSEGDLDILSPALTCDEKSKYVDVFFNVGEPQIKRICSPAINISIVKYKKNLEELFLKIENDSNEYIEKLLSLDLQHISKNNQKIENMIERGNTFLWEQDKVIKGIVGQLKNDLKNMRNFLKQTMHDDYINIGTYDRYEFYHFTNTSLNLNIKVRSVQLSQMEKKYIHIDMVGFKEEVDKINSKLLALAKDIEEGYQKFKNILDQINDILYKEDDLFQQIRDKEEKEHKNTLQNIVKALSKNVFLLDNEHTLIFGEQSEYRRQVHKYLPVQNPIEYSFFMHLRKQGILKGDFKEFKLKDFNDDEKEKFRGELQSYITKELPNFDKELIERIEIRIVNDHFQLNIMETNGQMVDFNNTSLGRRWYFSYFFIKECLNQGDYLLIDEPAAFLHPDAQLCILQELEELVKSGIHVIICTHSPYMISTNLTSFHSVSLDEVGTKINHNQIAQIKHIHEEIGSFEINNLILNIDKKIVLVEGMRDVACLKAFMKIFDINGSMYDILSINGHPKYELIIEFIISNQRDYIQLMDYDAKEQHSNSEKIIFVGEGTKEQSMEGIFSKKDQERYFDSNNKVDIEKMKQAKVDQIEQDTLDNFHRLLVELQII